MQAHYAQSLDSWAVVAEAMERIWWKCNPHSYDYQGGQLVHPDQWTVTLKTADC